MCCVYVCVLITYSKEKREREKKGKKIERMPPWVDLLFFFSNSSHQFVFPPLSLSLSDMAFKCFLLIFKSACFLFPLSHL